MIGKKVRQDLVLEMIALTNYNEFNGEKVVAALKANKSLWRSVWMCRLDDLIVLRDLDQNTFNQDTVYIRPVKGKEAELWNLVSTWQMDERDWIPGNEACRLLGSYSREEERNNYQILRLWWD